ncbi:hypothetical protein N7495_005055 [Penicillium taxi]|uniref:uncharacterized protein n=1 Tax=Penicillium taxi TaxID=168475 RepID=UPI002545B6C1|nr:uncharacterized protein N7495_005055 [Penicillium taxi]KAJ5893364.1 hypothetical protein N7495_005055 [Penicillium taxi]
MSAPRSKSRTAIHVLFIITGAHNLDGHGQQAPCGFSNKVYRKKEGEVSIQLEWNDDGSAVGNVGGLQLFVDVKAMQVKIEKLTSEMATTMATMMATMMTTTY